MGVARRVVAALLLVALAVGAAWLLVELAAAALDRGGAFVDHATLLQRVRDRSWSAPGVTAAATVALLAGLALLALALSGGAREVRTSLGPYVHLRRAQARRAMRRAADVDGVEDLALRVSTRRKEARTVVVRGRERRTAPPGLRDRVRDAVSTRARHLGLSPDVVVRIKERSS